MQRVVRWLAWRSNQPAALRWLEAAVLFIVALALRFCLGPLRGAVPSLIFYPAILIAAVFLGWQEALFVLGMSLIAGWFFFLPPGGELVPIGWAVVGILNIAVIVALRELAQELARGSARQRILFQELQHRVANTLQASVGRLEVVRMRMESDAAGAAALLQEAICRMADSADMHRRLHDPSLFSRGVEPMLRDAVSAVIDQAAVKLHFQVDELKLTLDQMSIIAMLVIEIANNALKHVFQQNLGSRFEVSLRALPGNRAMLRTWDDGPGGIVGAVSPEREQRLGGRILQGLADQIRGTLRIGYAAGTEIVVEFPTIRV
jgi:two-component sensor histidine kinase